KRMRVQAFLIKGYANSYIKQKCAQEKLLVTDEFLDEIRLEKGIESDAEIIRLIEKKMRGKVKPANYQDFLKLKNKLTHFLISKGHDYSHIKKALSSFFTENT